jgi:hypothetical protein
LRGFRLGNPRLPLLTEQHITLSQLLCGPHHHNDHQWLNSADILQDSHTITRLDALLALTDVPSASSPKGFHVAWMEVTLHRDGHLSMTEWKEKRTGEGKMETMKEMEPEYESLPQDVVQRFSLHGGPTPLIRYSSSLRVRHLHR